MKSAAPGPPTSNPRPTDSDERDGAALDMKRVPSVRLSGLRSGWQLCGWKTMGFNRKPQQDGSLRGRSLITPSFFPFAPEEHGPKRESQTVQRLASLSGLEHQSAGRALHLKATVQSTGRVNHRIGQGSEI